MVGRTEPKARVSIVRWNLKEAGFGEHTNPRANLWPDVQKSHIRFSPRVRLQNRPKPHNIHEVQGQAEDAYFPEQMRQYRESHEADRDISTRMAELFWNSGHEEQH